MGTAKTSEDGTNLFIDYAHRMPRLSREQEDELLARYREHADLRARDKLIDAHLRDVVFVALRHRYYGVPVGDLIAEGNLGLLRALAKYDTAKGTRFGTYAVFWVRAYVVTHVLRTWSMVGNRTGVLRTKLFFKLRRERARLQSLHGEGEETDALLAERLNVSRERLDKMIRRIEARDLSLDAPMNEESGATMLDALASDHDQERALASAEVNRLLGGALRTALPRLDRRERFIAESRLLADAEEELSLAEIGRKLGVSRERARQLETRTREKLGKALSEHGNRTDWTGTEAASAA